MFTVYDKKTSQQVEVFDVQRDKCGHAQFLVEVDNQWLYRSAKHYTRIEPELSVEEINEIVKSQRCNHDYYEAKRLTCQPPHYIDEILYRCKNCGHEYWL